MAIDNPQEHTSSIIRRILIALLSSDGIDVALGLWRLAKRVIAFKAHEGLYEVQNLDVRLELQDINGKKATLYKREKVRFLQDNTIAFEDSAYGDGEIFADYKCSPGVAVDRYQEGYRYRILISLRETKKHGDIEEFNIERTIHDGFTQVSESFQVDVRHVTRKLSISIVFPQKRIPTEVSLVEQNSARTTLFGPKNRRTLPDGRQVITWATEKPGLFEGYVIRWLW